MSDIRDEINETRLSIARSQIDLAGMIDMWIEGIRMGIATDVLAPSMAMVATQLRQSALKLQEQVRTL